MYSAKRGWDGWHVYRGHQWIAGPFAYQSDANDHARRLNEIRAS